MPSLNARPSLTGIRRPLALAVLVALTASACASFPSAITPGQSRDQVIAQFGRPTVEPNGPAGHALIYATGPFGQQTFVATLGPDNRVTDVAQALSLAGFAKIQKDQWTKSDVLAHFGPPAERVRYRGYDDVWNYRYRENNVYDSQMSVEFDADGVVRRVENGPDPTRDPGAHDAGGHV